MFYLLCLLIVSCGNNNQSSSLTGSNSSSDEITSSYYGYGADEETYLSDPVFSPTGDNIQALHTTGRYLQSGSTTGIYFNLKDEILPEELILNHFELKNCSDEDKVTIKSVQQTYSIEGQNTGFIVYITSSDLTSVDCELELKNIKNSTEKHLSFRHIPVRFSNHGVSLNLYNYVHTSKDNVDLLYIEISTNYDSLVSENWQNFICQNCTYRKHVSDKGIANLVVSINDLSKEVKIQLPQGFFVHNQENSLASNILRYKHKIAPSEKNIKPNIYLSYNQEPISLGLQQVALDGLMIPNQSSIYLYYDCFGYSENFKIEDFTCTNCTINNIFLIPNTQYKSTGQSYSGFILEVQTPSIKEEFSIALSSMTSLEVVQSPENENNGDSTPSKIKYKMSVPTISLKTSDNGSSLFYDSRNEENKQLKFLFRTSLKNVTLASMPMNFMISHNLQIISTSLLNGKSGFIEIVVKVIDEKKDAFLKVEEGLFINNNAGTSLASNKVNIRFKDFFSTSNNEENNANPNIIEKSPYNLIVSFSKFISPDKVIFIVNSMIKDIDYTKYSCTNCIIQDVVDNIAMNGTLVFYFTLIDSSKSMNFTFLEGFLSNENYYSTASGPYSYDPNL